MRKTAVGMFLLLGVLWGGAYPAIKIGVEVVPPVLYAAVRYDIAGVVMLCYILVGVDDWYPTTGREWLTVLLGGGLLIGAYNAFLFLGETTVPSGVAGVLVGLMPILTSVFTRLLLPDREIDRLGVFGVTAGFVGVVVISRPTLSSVLSSDFLGQALIVLAAGSMALGSVLTERVDAELPAITVETWSMVIGAGVLHLTAALRGAPAVWTVSWTSEAVTALVYLSVFSSAIAYFLYFYLLEELGAFEMNFIAYLAAAFGVLSGWLVLNEQVTAFVLAGYVLIFGGFLLIKAEEIRSQFADAKLAERVRG